MEDNKPINELFDQFTNGELSGFESQTTKDLEISTPVGKHHSDDLKVNLSVLTKKNQVYCRTSSQNKILDINAEMKITLSEEKVF